MYTIHDYSEQVETCKCELGTLSDIVEEFLERWQGILGNIEETINCIDDIPTEY